MAALAKAEFGDDVEVYGAAYGIADFGLYYPLVVTTMQIVNHGEEGLYKHDLVEIK